MGFSFETVDARDYEELRPGYAPEAARWVFERAELGPGSLVVDLAAGTGQLSRRFLELGVRVVAVEPARNMREVLAQALPAVRTLDGVAERIPLGDGVADAVVVGNAFHHLDEAAAFAEIRRVLRPKGALGIFWAWSSEDDGPIRAGLREVDEALARSRVASAFVSAYLDWSEAPHPALGYADVERREFPTTHLLPSARLADLYATSSDVASIAEPDRSALLERVRDRSRGFPETLELPIRSVVDLYERD
ncbi:MAG TPA: class I SAM-dependent methyltransferase [Actinomycetota bacterium]|nr:class I SAM-dependent methyltransferase [Actinomycetota bacterium]